MNIWQICFLLSWWLSGLVLLRIILTPRYNEGIRAAARPFAYLTLFNAGCATFLVLAIGSRVDGELSTWTCLTLSLWLTVPMGFSQLGGLLHRTVALDRATLPRLRDPSAGAIRICHLSDLHLATQPSLGLGFAPDILAAKAEQWLRWGLDHADVVVLTGDITDRGNEAEWVEFGKIMAGLGNSARDRILVIPGNHDISLTTNFLLMDSDHDVARENRCRFFAEACFAESPHTWRLSGTANGSIREMFDSAAAFRAAHLEFPIISVVSGGMVGTSISPELRTAAAGCLTSHPWPSKNKFLYAHLQAVLYPMIMMETRDVVVIGLDSTRVVSDSMLSSAFGRVGRRQLHKLALLLDAFRERHVVILIHHHVGCPSDIRKGLTESAPWIAVKALQLRDAAALHTILRKWGGSATIFHGHKHVGYQAVKGQVSVISAPSVAYGDLLNEQMPVGRVYSISKKHRAEQVAGL